MIRKHYLQVGDPVIISRVAVDSTALLSRSVRVGDQGIVREILYENRHHRRRRQWVLVTLTGGRGIKYPASWLRLSATLDIPRE